MTCEKCLFGVWHGLWTRRAQLLVRGLGSSRAGLVMLSEPESSMQSLVPLGLSVLPASVAGGRGPWAGQPVLVELNPDPTLLKLATSSKLLCA